VYITKTVSIEDESKYNCFEQGRIISQRC